MTTKDNTAAFPNWEKAKADYQAGIDLHRANRRLTDTETILQVIEELSDKVNTLIKRKI